jgi:hypothetical protein
MRDTPSFTLRAFQQYPFLYKNTSTHSAGFRIGRLPAATLCKSVHSADNWVQFPATAFVFTSGTSTHSAGFLIGRLPAATLCLSVHSADNWVQFPATAFVFTSGTSTHSAGFCGGRLPAATPWLVVCPFSGQFVTVSSGCFCIHFRYFHPFSGLPCGAASSGYPLFVCPFSGQFGAVSSGCLFVRYHPIQRGSTNVFLCFQAICTSTGLGPPAKISSVANDLNFSKF